MIYSVGTHYGNLLNSPVTLSRVITHFIQPAHTRGRKRIWKKENADEQTGKI